MAAEVRPDYLIGGTLIEPVQEIIAGTGIRFFPYVGQIVGHPCLLRGSIDEIAADARARRGARRRRHQPARLPLRRRRRRRSSRRSSQATSLPVIAAGSVDSVERIRALADLGVWAFTIGTAALDGVLVPGAPLGEQLDLRSRPREDTRVGREPPTLVVMPQGDDALVDHAADDVVLLAVGGLQVQRIAEREHDAATAIHQI